MFIARIERLTKETQIDLKLSLSQNESIRTIDSGLPFLDHMIDNLCCHAGLDIELKACGDLQVDDHHSVEDIALSLGQALRLLFNESNVIEGRQRFGSAYAPLDESLSRVVLDFVSRPYASIELSLKRDSIGQVACENISHFFQSMAMAGQFTLHVDVIKGANDHHKVESAFKAMALALRQAFSLSGKKQILSTKGVL